MAEKSTKPEMVMENQDVFVKVFFNKGKTKFAAQILSGEYVVCDLNAPDPYLDTMVFDRKPEELTHSEFLTWERLIDSDLKWLFFAIVELLNQDAGHNWAHLLGDRKEDDLEITLMMEDGWQIVFPISKSNLYMHIPPMFYTQRKTH